MFKRGITFKLFLAILATCVLVAVAMGVAARVTFNRGFVGYLNAQGEERVQSLLPKLAAAYADQGGWACIQTNPRLWYRLLRPPVPNTPEEPRQKGCPERDRNRNDPPPPEGSNTPERRNRDPNLALPESDLTGVNLRLALLDANRQLVIGNPLARRDALLQPVEVEGRTVGWLALVPFENASTAAGQRFAEQQLHANWVIAGLALLLAAVVALLLARGFLAPLRRVAQGTQALAAGHYESRVPVASRDELGQLAQDFNRLAEALQKTEQMRRAFMADVSHELRTPLAVLRGELEALEDGVRPLNAQALRSLQAETATLSQLVSDLYDLSLADVGALSYRMAVVDMAALVEHSARPYRERMAAQGLQLSVNVPAAPLWVLADEARLQQLITNLLENSLRYTDPTGSVHLSLRAEGSEVLMQLEDSAPGVPPELLPKLFERFFRVEASRNRASGGAGLGLAICAKIVEAHHGRLQAAPSPLGGLRLSVWLPAVEGGRA